MNFSKLTTFCKHGYTTDSRLLSRLAASDEKAWGEFDQKYRSMVYAVGRRRGLSLSDCEDLMQEVMLVCCRRLSTFSYDRKKGKFRSYLTVVINNISWQMLRQKPPVTAFLQEYDEGIDSVFMKEYEAFLLGRILDLLKEHVSSETYSVFEMLCIQQIPVEKISQITRKSKTSIYLIRHRCMRILKSCVAEIPEAAERIHRTGNSSKKP